MTTHKKSLNNKDLRDQILRHYEALSPEGKERFICAVDPYYFLTRYVQTYDPYEGIQPYPDFGYLEHTIHAEQDNRLNIYLKGRQLTFSWTFSAYGLWESQFKFAANSLYTSKRQEDAFELKDRARFMWDHMPDFLRVPITEDNKSTMSFGSNLSKLKFLPATDNVGRTYTAGHVYMDEFAHVSCNAGKMFTSIKPTINAGGRCTIFSSPNGPQGKFYELCGGRNCPPSGWGIMVDSGFIFHFMPYTVHPLHDANWEANAFRGMTTEEIDQEYRALWIKRGGRVYPLFSREHHVVEPFDIPDNWLKFRGIDFGGSNPTAVVWIAFSPDGRAYIYREYKQAQRPIKEHADRVKIDSQGERYAGTISDHDSQNRIEWETQGVRTMPAVKDWESGFNEVTKHLMVDSNGNVGLSVFSDCTDVIHEFSNYSWPEVDRSKRDAPEKPLKLNDHLMDCIRYVFRTTMQNRARFKPVRELKEGSSILQPNGVRGEKSIFPLNRLNYLNSILIPTEGLGILGIHTAIAGGKPISRISV